MLDRRHLIKGAGAGIWALGAGTAFGTINALALDTVTMPFENGERPLVKYPQKRPMIGLTSRPPQLETPFSVFNEGAITPNDAFFVRYHLAGIPLASIPTRSPRDQGQGRQAAETLAAGTQAIRRGRDRGGQPMLGQQPRIFQPRVAGGQLGNGAMGNARWNGVPLKAVLDKAGVQRGARQVDVQRTGRTGQRQDAGLRQGARHRPRPRRRGDAGLCHERRRICRCSTAFRCGWSCRAITAPTGSSTSTKSPSSTSVFDGFWMKSAYRIPDNECACVAPGTAPKATVPIGRFNVRSFITNVTDGAKLKAGGDDAAQRHRLRRRLWHHRSRRCRPTAARPGRRRRSARISANTRSANGGCR